jgi:aminoglycoside/choline kinase family phosphotransferase
MIQLNEIKAREFLVKNNIAQYLIIKVAGDASFRSYYRILDADKKYILMFAPPSHEDTAPFVRVDNFLLEQQFSAPKIHAIDALDGFILLEDFGDDTYTKVLAKTSSQDLKETELQLYQKACDCLTELHQKPLPQDLPHYNNALLFREVMLFLDWYLPLQKKEITVEQIALFKSLWFELFDQLSKENQVVVLRDYHADNLMILPSRHNHQQVGLLDFQDAVIGSKAYDLVSLLEDARRDLNEENRQKLFDYYLQKLGCDEANFKRDYEILSLQRNIKIVGIFSRLSVRDGKHHYLNLLPRVLNFVDLRLNSSNPIFLEMAKLLEKFI